MYGICDFVEASGGINEALDRIDYELFQVKYNASIIVGANRGIDIEQRLLDLDGDKRDLENLKIKIQNLNA